MEVMVSEEREEESEDSHCYPLGDYSVWSRLQFCLLDSDDVRYGQKLVRLRVCVRVYIQCSSVSRDSQDRNLPSPTKQSWKTYIHNTVEPLIQATPDVQDTPPLC